MGVQMAEKVEGRAAKKRWSASRVRYLGGHTTLGGRQGTRQLRNRKRYGNSNNRQKVDDAND